MLPGGSRTISKIICQETCQAKQKVRCQGCRAECATLKYSSLVSVKACQGIVAVSQEVKVVSPDIFGVFCKMWDIVPGLISVLYRSCTTINSNKRKNLDWGSR